MTSSLQYTPKTKDQTWTYLCNNF